MKKKLILLDIDHTVFNTQSFRKALFDKIADLYKTNPRYHQIPNICQVICDEIISRYGFFDTQQFLELFPAEIGEKESSSEIAKYFIDSSLMEEHVHTDVKEALHELAKLGKIGILSQGENKYQRAKIASFEHILIPEYIYIAKDKKILMSKIFNELKEYTIFFIDDTLSMLDNATTIEPGIKTIWIRRKHDGIIPDQNKIFDFKPFATVNTLSEAVDVISEV